MAIPPLLATCWTHAGTADPRQNDGLSNLPIIDRIAAVAAAGWQGIGFRHSDLLRARETIGYGELARAFHDSGLAYAEVESLDRWWTTGLDRRRSDRARLELFEAAHVLGAHVLKVCAKGSDKTNLDDMSVAFDALANDARNHGLRIGLEPMPFSKFRTVLDGGRFVAAVENSNGGLFIDSWHVMRGGTSLAELRANIAPESIVAVELNDARDPAPAPEKLWDDTVDERQLPGEGDWDIPGFIHTIRDLGYSGVWGVEILSRAHRAKPLEDQVSTALKAAQRTFAEADRTLDAQLATRGVTAAPARVRTTAETRCERADPGPV
jgi:sugar phosphate isomerase/epimerase